jgi:hypothetical protein
MLSVERTGENSFLKKDPLRLSTAARSLSAHSASTVTVAPGAAQSARTSKNSGSCLARTEATVAGSIARIELKRCVIGSTVRRSIQPHSRA